MDSVYRRLLDEIAALRIIDTHEHLPLEKDLPKEDADVLASWLTHYFSCDLVSAGLPLPVLVEAKNTRLDLRERWERIEPFWRKARNTGYARALYRTARDLFGVDDINGRTLPALNEAVRAARKGQNGYYRWLLGEKSRIAVSIVDPLGSTVMAEALAASDPFVYTHRAGTYLQPPHRMEMQRKGAEVGVSVHSLEDWEEVIRRHLKRFLVDEERVVCLKVGEAYNRILHFQKRTHAEAEAVFIKWFQEEHSPASHPAPGPSRVLQDYLMHEVLRFADAHGLVIQIHTGIQEGHGNVITDANPTHLTNLFLEYSNVRFDLFHMGYPYQQEAAVLAKNFPNVYLDMCWGHIISPEAARRALSEWLDSVPANKIMGFGGDYLFPEGVYGHQAIARENVAWVLAEKVERGDFGLDEAREIARWLFVDNPATLFGLEAHVR